MPVLQLKKYKTNRNGAMLTNTAYATATGMTGGLGLPIRAVWNLAQLQAPTVR